jgi:serine/threonine protein kinase
MDSQRNFIFLSYNGLDRFAVETIKELLQTRGIRTFLDRDNLIVGLPWPQALEDALNSVDAVAVFLGPHGLGSWQMREMWFALDRQVQEEKAKRPFPVIPILLPEADPTPGFLFLNTWVDLRHDLADSQALDALVRAVQGALPQQPLEMRDALCPYRGLQAFREEDAAFFHGREAFAEKLLGAVLRQELVAVVGPSGSGKSSVVQAGLLPLLRRQRPPADTWDVVLFTPGDRPFHRLAAALVPLLEPNLLEMDWLKGANRMGDLLANGQILLEDVVERALQKLGGTNRLLLVSDQFEQLFTRTPDPDRKRFVQALISALARAPLTLAITLRADFYGHMIALSRDLSDRVERGVINLGPMTRPEMAQAISMPAQHVGLKFQPRLIERILNDMGEEPGRLPLLEFALTELWFRRQDGLLTHSAYEEIGGVTKAIVQRAEDVFQKFSPEQQRITRRIFTRLVRVARPEEGGEDTSRRAALADLGEEAREIIVELANARLLVTGRERINDVEEETVDLAHEALIRGWDRLGDWLDQDRNFLLWQQRLQSAMQQWEDSNRNEDEGLRGALLREAEIWLQERRADLNQAEQVFILFCLGLREHTSDNLDQAHEYYLQALDVDVSLAEIHYYLHLLLLEKGQLDEALQEHNQAIAAKPELAIVPSGYVVTKILSASGPFITYQAEDAQKDVVIFKVLKRAYDKREVLDVLRLAVDRSQKLEHPSIVKIKTFEEIRNRHYLVREYVTGRSLRELIDEEGPLSLKVSSEILVQLCSTLTTIHSQGIVYGNLKPTNIYWIDTQVKLTDLGLAAVSPSGEYLPPERLQGREAAQADVYAVGAVFYEMLTRRKPGSGFSPSRLDSALELVIERACAPTAEERYPSIDVFLDELSQVIPRQCVPRNARWTGRLVALSGQVTRETAKRTWPWILAATLGLGLLAPLFGEAILVRQTVRTASVLLTMIFILATLIGWLSVITARKVRNASIAAYGGAMGALLSLASGLLWLRSFVFQMPDSPSPCNPDYLQPLGLGQVANLMYAFEVMPAYLIGSLITSLFVFAAISATGALTRRLGWQYKTGFFIGFLFWLPVLTWAALRLNDGWFGCF